jgi:hypothetical protein
VGVDGDGGEGGAGGSQHACALSGGLEHPAPLAVFRSLRERTRTLVFLVVLAAFFEALRRCVGMIARCPAMAVPPKIHSDHWC